MSWEPLIFIFAVICGLVVLVVWTVKASKKVKLNWMRAAYHLGLKYVPGKGLNPGILKGVFKENHFWVETYEKEVKVYNKTAYIPHTKFHLRYKTPQPFRFVLSSRREEVPVESKGKSSISIGDPSFDDIVRVQCEGEDKEKMSALFTRHQRRKLALAFLGNKNLVITDRGIKLERNEKIKHEDLLTIQIKALSRLADVVWDCDKEEEEEERAKGKKKKKHPRKHSRGKHVHQDSEEPCDTKKTEEEKIVADSDASAKKDADEKKKTSDKQFSLDDLCEELFSGIGSVEAERIFDEKYKDRQVEMDGVLRSAGKFSYDLVFKDGPAVKATFIVKEMESHYSRMKIKAVVRYPESELEKLKKAVGKKIAFSGKLTGIDTLLKTIFLQDGETLRKRRESGGR